MHSDIEVSLVPIFLSDGFATVLWNFGVNCHSTYFHLATWGSDSVWLVQAKQQETERPICVSIVSNKVMAAVFQRATAALSRDGAEMF